MNNPVIDLVEKQLYHYNRKELEPFLEVFSEEVEVFILGEKEASLVGRDAMRQRYVERFKSEGLHAKVTNRMVKDSVVIDYEEVTGIVENEVTIAIAIYEIQGEFIKKVHFVK
jgi:hypothetical protein